MVEVAELRNRYNELYRCLREYTWDISVIRLLSRLECECYTGFFDSKAIRSILRQLKVKVSSVYSDNEEMQYAFSEFDDTLNNIEKDGMYMNLIKFQEVVQ